MNIGELRAGTKNVNLLAEVTEKGETREFEKFGRPIRVATAQIKDNTGSVALSLWNEEIELVKVGDKIKLTNGYVKEFQGDLQASAGKYGTLEVIEGNKDAI